MVGLLLRKASRCWEIGQPPASFTQLPGSSKRQRKTRRAKHANDHRSSFNQPTVRKSIQSDIFERSCEARSEHTLTHAASRHKTNVPYRLPSPCAKPPFLV